MNKVEMFTSLGGFAAGILDVLNDQKFNDVVWTIGED